MDIQAHGCVGRIVEDSDEDDDDGWEECMDQDPIQTECLCLFCDDKLASPEAMFIHCRAKHQFDIYRIHKEYNLDCFSYIKMVNYIRGMHPSPDKLNEKLPSGVALWASDDFMKPVLENDGLLQFDIEALSVDCSEEPGCTDGHCCGVESDFVKPELSPAVDARLLRDLRAAKDRALVAEDQLKLVLADLAKMRTVAKQMMSQIPVLPPSDQAIQNLKSSEDDSYFDSYGHYSIHQDMLQDRIRTESYRDAICCNPDLFRDKVVLDIGCGTGILSMFAARAGAKLVIGVEMSDIIYQAMDIIRENGLEDKVKLVKGRMEDVDLPVEKVDIIISEWMGYFLLFESMLDTILWARDKYLVHGGVILPDRCNMSLAAVDDQEMHQRNYGYWSDVYGFKMTCMRTAVQKEASVLCVNASTVISEPCVIKELDVCTCSTKDLEFTSPFNLTIQREGNVTAIMGYFDIQFSKGTKKVAFSTDPSHTQTHWKQTVFLLDKPISVMKGDELKGELTCKKNYKDPRTLVIHLTIRDKTFKYTMQ